jgi:hypothetical protein
METYTKLFSSIIHSSVWREANHIRLVWITMMAMADRDGYVGASLPGLAAAAGVTLDETADAIGRFLAPDRYSRSQEHEGRRIAVADRGWFLLNHPRFRAERTEEIRKEQNAAAQRRHRERKAADRHADNADSQQSKPRSAQADTDTEADSETPSGSPPIAPKRGRSSAWRRFPKDWEPSDEHRKLAADLRVNMELELEKIRDFDFARPRRDPDAVFRTWLRTAADRAGSSPRASGNAAADNTRRAVERARRLTAEYEARVAAGTETP